ncbi:hypothetical protein [Nannocystis pusilla]|uniref:hypothetical protein n=1 Tax=Nannocystis pusilla TaxID=889268 RepID=UPI003DA69418
MERDLEHRREPGAVDRGAHGRGIDPALDRRRVGLDRRRGLPVPGREGPRRLVEVAEVVLFFRRRPALGRDHAVDDPPRRAVVEVVVVVVAHGAGLGAMCLGPAGAGRPAHRHGGGGRVVVVVGPRRRGLVVGGGQGGPQLGVVVVDDVAEREAAGLAADDLREAGRERDLAVVEERAAAFTQRRRRRRSAALVLDHAGIAALAVLGRALVDEVGRELGEALPRLLRTGRRLVVVVGELKRRRSARRRRLMTSVPRRRRRTGTVALIVHGGAQGSHIAR